MTDGRFDFIGKPDDELSQAKPDEQNKPVTEEAEGAPFRTSDSFTEDSKEADYGGADSAYQPAPVASFTAPAQKTNGSVSWQEHSAADPGSSTYVPPFQTEAPAPAATGAPATGYPSGVESDKQSYNYGTGNPVSGVQNGYGYYTQQPTVPTPPVYSYTPASGYSSNGQPAASGKRRTIGLGGLITVAVACAIAASMITSLFFVGAGLVAENGDAEGTVVTSGSDVKTIVNNSNSTVEAVAEKASDSIVGIRVTTSQNYFFYGTQESTSEGSGVIYTSDGYIITNYHVIESSVKSNSMGKIEVFLNNGSSDSYPATVIGYEIASDLAVVKINLTGLTPMEIGDSDGLKLGQTVICIGNPGGISYIGSVSQGIISGLNRTVSIDNIGDMTLIQTDAAVNPGNSGGALLNDTGKLIGIVSSKIVSEEYEGIGFAIPVNTTVDVVEKIINNEGTARPYSGLTISTSYDSKTLNQMGYPSGVVVESASGPAETAGIERGDIITSFNGKEITSYAEYNAALEDCSAGQTIEIVIYRNRRSYTATVTLGETYN